MWLNYAVFGKCCNIVCPLGLKAVVTENPDNCLEHVRCLNCFPLIKSQKLSNWELIYQVLAVITEWPFWPWTFMLPFVTSCSLTGCSSSVLGPTSKKEKSRKDESKKYTPAKFASFKGNCPEVSPATSSYISFTVTVSIQAKGETGYCNWFCCFCFSNLCILPILTLEFSYGKKGIIGSG